MTDVAQCACLRVEYKTTQHDNGTVTGRWLCAYGGDHEFVPIGQLRAALARAERAEALVREAGVMLKEREWDDPVCPEGYLEGMACSNCLAHEDNKHDPGCHYAALLARIAELEKP